MTVAVRTRRLLARAIDEAIALSIQFPCILAAALFAGMSGVAKPGREDDANRLALTILVAGWLIPAAYELGSTWNGASVGKALNLLALIDTRSGSHPTFRQAVVRWLVLSSTQPLVWLWLLLPKDDPGQRAVLIAILTAALTWRLILGISALVARDGQAIHDRLCRTRVVTRRP